MSDHPLHRVLSVPGVVQVDKMVTQFMPWKRRSGGQQLSIIVGFDVNARMFAPWNVISGSPEALQLPDTVIIDSLYKDRLEITRLGDTAAGNVHDSHRAKDFILACIAIVRAALPGGLYRGAHGQRRAPRVDTHPWYRYAEALPALRTAISKSGSRHRKGGTT